MPITIVPVQPGNAFGPGLLIDAQSDFVGPLTFTTQWQLDFAHDAEFNQIAYSVSRTALQSPILHILLFSESVQGMFAPGVMNDGDTVHVQARLVDGSTTLDSGVATGTWKATAGLGAQQLVFAPIPQQGGFTFSDRQQLALAVSNTSVSVPSASSPTGFVQQALSSLFSGVHPHYLNRHGSILVSGQGSLARGTEPFRGDSIGIEWHWHTIPAGFGESLGSVSELGRRIVQWRMISRDSANQLFQLEYVDSNTEGVRHVWGPLVPETLEWFVAPGCVVELSFLVFAFG